MEDRLVTVAIHTYEKAQILKSVLEIHGIDAYIHNVNQILPVISAGVRVRIRESDLPKALAVIEDMNNTEAVYKALEEVNKQSMVLLPIDFSDYSLKACEFGFNFAAINKAEVVLFHAYLPPSFSSMPIGDVINYDNHKDDDTIRKMLEKSKGEIDKLCVIIDEKINSGAWPNVKYRKVLREGVPEEQIIGYAERHKPLSIVMGTRGKDQKDADLIGSVTAEIIERSRVPVFTIPENIMLNKIEDIKNIAYSTNFEDKDLIAFEKLVSFLKPYNFKMHFIHYNNNDDNWAEIKLSGIKEYFQRHYSDIEFEYHLLDGEDILSAYDKFIHDNNIDVVSMTTHRRNLFSRLFNPSMARKMVFHTDTPMLVFHA